MSKKEPEFSLETQSFLGIEKTMDFVERLLIEGKQFAVVPDNLSWAVTCSTGPVSK